MYENFLTVERVNSLALVVSNTFCLLAQFLFYYIIKMLYISRLEFIFSTAAPYDKDRIIARKVLSDSFQSEPSEAIIRAVAPVRSLINVTILFFNSDRLALARRVNAW